MQHGQARLDQLTGESLLSSHQVSWLLQVDPTSIQNWVKAGHIRAFRTPGGHIRVRAADLVSFLDQHGMLIPERLRHVAKRRVLFVDDDLPLLRTFKRALKPYEDQVVIELVENGIDALVRVGAFRPHAVVLDIEMPELDGIEVCRRLKANSLTSGTEIFIFSGHLDARRQQQAIEAGAKKCFSKPFDLNALFAELGLTMPAAWSPAPLAAPQLAETERPT